MILKARTIPIDAPLRITVNGADWPNRFPSAEAVDWDGDGVKDLRRCLDLTGFSNPMPPRAGSGVAASGHKIKVLAFPVDSKPINVNVFVEGGTGWAFRDTAGIVPKSTTGPDGDPGFTEGVYRQFPTLDQMPATGSGLTHSLRPLVPASSSTVSAWSSGSKTPDSAVWPIRCDSHLRTNFGPHGLERAADKPWIESLAQLLKRIPGIRKES